MKEGAKNHITFVQEFATYGKNFDLDTRPVAAVSVSRCILMEMNNRNSKNQRTAFSLTHFVVSQLDLPDSKIIEENLATVMDNFVKVGGDIKSAQIRLYGGFEKGAEIRDNLKRCLMNKYGVKKVEEPAGHKVVHEDESWDYLFKADGITCRKSDMRFEPKEYKDLYSSDLQKDGKPDKQKIEQFSKMLDQEYYKFAPNQKSQSELKMESLCNKFGEKTLSLSDYNSLSVQDSEEYRRMNKILVVNDKGLFSDSLPPKEVQVLKAESLASAQGNQVSP